MKGRQSSREPVIWEKGDRAAGRKIRKEKGDGVEMVEERESIDKSEGEGDDRVV